ncbi:MAG: hypothetical protein FWH56_03335 [Betaproteobacteria bacterium]|nr:hypothetical protein [Betaproteobacteria bacterium]
MRLRELAHSRAGDKGDISNISLIALEPWYYPILEQIVTARRVKEHFVGIVHGEVTRYELPGLRALNFVLERTLGGGTTRTLAMDVRGRCLSQALLTLDFPELDKYFGESDTNFS